jgi:hypothetical protein
MTLILGALHAALRFLVTDLYLLLQGRVRLDQLIDDPHHLATYRFALAWPRSIPGRHLTLPGIAHILARTSCDAREALCPPLTFVVLHGEPLPYSLSSRISQ